jgi:CopG antitoxin of type II toxin-antitoxin system
MKKSQGKKKKTLTAEQLDAMHDAGVDMTDYMDWSKAARPGLEIQRVNVDFPKWMIERLDREAERLGVTRQSIIKVWIAERIAALTKKIA